MQLSRFQVDHYAIPLPVVLSDSTHGDMSEFGLITVRIADEEGVEGLGYTYTVGNIGGGAVASMVDRDLRKALELPLPGTQLLMYVCPCLGHNS